MIQTINPTSKASLKTQCLLMANGDVDQAERLYDFLSKDMPDLPTFDPVQPTVMQQVKETTSSVFAWINDNQESIANWVNIARSLFGKGGGTPPPTPPAAPLPPINS